MKVKEGTDRQMPKPTALGRRIRHKRRKGCWMAGVLRQKMTHMTLNCIKPEMTQGDQRQGTEKEIRKLHKK